MGPRLVATSDEKQRASNPGGCGLRVMCSSWGGHNLGWVHSLPGGGSARGRSRRTRDLITLAARSVTPPPHSYSTYLTQKRTASCNLRVRTRAAGPLQRSTGSELHACRTRSAFPVAKTGDGNADQNITDAMNPYTPVKLLRKLQGYGIISFGEACRSCPTRN